MATTSARQVRDDDVRVVMLEIQELTPEAFAPYGEVSGPTQAFSLDFSGQRPMMCHVRIEPRPFHLLFFARHLRSSQAYVPLGGQSSVLVVAPANDPLDPSGIPDISRAAAFRIDGSRAVNLYRGTWHRTPIPMGPRSDFLVLDRDGTLDDLDLVDLQGTLGVRIEIAV